MPSLPPAPARLPRIVLAGVRNPLNIGAAARAMANFGLDDLVLVRPYSEAWKTAKSARAGQAVLARARVADSLVEALSGISLALGTSAATGRKPEVALRVWPDALQEFDLRQPWALLFGSEKTGLTSGDLSFCQAVLRLKTTADSPSMNLGQAIAVCCYELCQRRARAPAPALAAPLAEFADMPARERIVGAFVPLLEHLGVFRSQHRDSQTRRLRRMLAHWQMTPGDARLLLGVARELRRVLGLHAPRG